MYQNKQKNTTLPIELFMKTFPLFFFVEKQVLMQFVFNSNPLIFGAIILLREAMVIELNSKARSSGWYYFFL